MPRGHTDRLRFLYEPFVLISPASTSTLFHALGRARPARAAARDLYGQAACAARWPTTLSSSESNFPQR
jgi:hypothetical protein